jgi:ribosomal protein S12 methylthiotransferase
MHGGHKKSTSIEDLLRETKKLAAKGTKELFFIAQDFTYHGLDIHNLSSM